MSRRNQARRRRAYGRRQHEVRERQVGQDDRAWLSDADSDGQSRWQPFLELSDEEQRYGGGSGYLQ